MSVRLYSCLVIRNANGVFSVPYVVICGLFVSTVFFHIVINGTIFGDKVTEHA